MRSVRRSQGNERITIPHDWENDRPVVYAATPFIGRGFYGLVDGAQEQFAELEPPAVAVPLTGATIPWGPIGAALALGSELRLYANPEPLSVDFIDKLKRIENLQFRVFHVGDSTSFKGYEFEETPIPEGIPAPNYGSLSMARQIAILQSYLAGEQTLLMLDDDITLTHRALEFCATADLDDCQAVGFRVKGFQDTDVIKRKKAKLRSIQFQLSAEYSFNREGMELEATRFPVDDFIVGGGALLVNSQTFKSYIPQNIYNEDIFQMLDAIRENDLLNFYGAGQPTDSNQPPKRAGGQEFGELLLNGDLWALRHGKTPPYCDVNMWKKVQKWRKLDLEMTLKEATATLDLVLKHKNKTNSVTDDEEASCEDAIAAANEALKIHENIKPEHCVAFEEARFENQKRFDLLRSNLRKMTIEESTKAFEISHTGALPPQDPRRVQAPRLSPMPYSPFRPRL